MYPAVDKSAGTIKEPKNAYYSSTFYQGESKTKTKAKRATVYDVFKGFGGQLAFILNFTGLAIGSMQAFSLSNSLIKKLYSS